MKIGDVRVGVQWNPARIQSTGAKLDAATLKKRPCFLCGQNRPSQQSFIPLEGGYEFLVNPFPILKNHVFISGKTGKKRMRLPPPPPLNTGSELS